MAATDTSANSGPDLIRATRLLGNMADESWRSRLADARVDVLRLDQAQAQKSRLRLATEGGTDVAIALDRGVLVRDGDVLAWNGADRAAVVARVELSDVLVIDLSGLSAVPADVAMATCVGLGHALGNQHWPAVIEGTRVYVPLTVTRAVMASVMKTHAFAGITYAFTTGAEVVPYLAPHESRRLFGAADGHQHSGQPSEAAP
jgi:urease accessory protein